MSLGALRSFTASLQDCFAQSDTTWSFNVANLPSPSITNGFHLIKSISMTSTPQCQEMKLRYMVSESNRAIDPSQLHKYMQISFEKFSLQGSANSLGIRTALPLRETADYKIRLMSSGICLNGTTYRFFGHSNSQLKSGTCYLFAGTEKEITAIIEGFGEFGAIKTVAKKSKRIGLLFSAAKVATELAPDRCVDIPDIKKDDYIFTDGCGLVSRHFAKRLVQIAQIRFRNQRFLPSVFQIRYRGYKGVLTLEPNLSPQHLVHFRDSMRKFKGCDDISFAVVDFARPYAFGFLNDEVILLLSALGVGRETFERKQREHLQFLHRAKSSALDAFRFLSYMNETALAERVLLEGLPLLANRVQRLIHGEIGKMTNKRGNTKSRILIPRSRLLFGVCDPRNVLREGECAIRVTMAQDGAAKTIVGTEVLVTRNPCLHPGDLQKFRAVQYPELSHLIDCIIFSVKGRRPSADLMSGGDLDGDKFFVCWDPDVIPGTVAQPARYLGVKEPLTFGPITYAHRLVYFASYTNASLGRVKNLYLDWAKAKGPMSAECQELNYLFSNCVDGNRISIPSHLLKTPDLPRDAEPFILDFLHGVATSQFDRQTIPKDYFTSTNIDIVEMLLCREDIAMSEFELFQLTMRWCTENKQIIAEFLDLFDFNQFSDNERVWVLSQLPESKTIASHILNALQSSAILSPSELDHFKLNYPGIRWKLLYSSAIDRLGLFMPSLGRAMELFVRKLITIQVDNRLSIALYVPTRLRSRNESVVNDTCRLFAFPHTKAGENSHRLAVPTSTNYHLYYNNATLQLYRGKRSDTWIFISKPGENDASYKAINDIGDRRRQRQATLDAGENAECIVSIALNKFSSTIARHVGRINRSKVLAAEVYVISNRDIRSLQLLDEWLRFIDTRETIPLFENARKEYRTPSLKDVQWDKQTGLIIEVARRRNFSAFAGATVREFEEVFTWLIEQSKSDTLRQIYRHLLPDAQGSFRAGGRTELLRSMFQLLPRVPSLVLELSNIDYWKQLPEEITEVFESYQSYLLEAIILCANEMQSFVLAPFRKVVTQIRSMSFSMFANIVEYISLTVERPEVALDLLMGVLEPESARILTERPRLVHYFIQNCIGIAIDHIEEGSEHSVQREDWFQLAHANHYDQLTARIRIDAQSIVRLASNDHVCLQATQMPQNTLTTIPYSMHALVVQSQPGSVRFQIFHPAPPFLADTTWKLQHRGSFVTSRSMFEALSRFVIDADAHCALQKLLLCYSPKGVPEKTVKDSVRHRDSLNKSQNKAVQAILDSSLVCLWGPPGTGKTHTLAVALEELLVKFDQDKILVTAPTHNAVDNLLRTFIESMRKRGKSLPNLVRVSTEVRRVASDILKYTCDAMAGKDLNENPASRKKAQKQVDQARVVFTTCTGASLGLLREARFPIVIIDEASQQTEAQSLIPLCKGCERAVLAGDHVQLRATVRPLAQLQGYDISMFERLFNADQLDMYPPALIQRVMLDTQYRMHRSLCAFSSRKFYNDQLETAVLDDQRPLPAGFPWPKTVNGSPARLIFAQSHHKEDLGGRSKNNPGQVKVACTVCKLLLDEAGTRKDNAGNSNVFSIAVLTPYTACAEALRSNLPSNISVSSIDGFQGREADVIIFVTTRCNMAGQIGFLRDMRRLNVVLTRAKAALIVIGDKATLAGRKCISEKDVEVDVEVDKAKMIWADLIEDCVEFPSTFYEEQGLGAGAAISSTFSKA